MQNTTDLGTGKLNPFTLYSIKVKVQSRVSKGVMSSRGQSDLLLLKLLTQLIGFLQVSVFVQTVESEILPTLPHPSHQPTTHPEQRDISLELSCQLVAYLGYLGTDGVRSA